MTNYKISMAVFMALAFISGSAFAQMEMGGFREGDHALSLSGSGSSDHDFDSSVASVEVELAWFLTDVTSVALRQGIGYADQPAGSDDWSGSTRLAFDYFFPVEQCAPFIGVSIGYLYGDNTEETFAAGPEIGLRHFLNETTFINAVVEYEFLFEDADEADEQFDDGRFVYTLGLGVRL